MFRPILFLKGLHSPPGVLVDLQGNGMAGGSDRALGVCRLSGVFSAVLVLLSGSLLLGTSPLG